MGQSCSATIDFVIVQTKVEFLVSSSEDACLSFQKDYCFTVIKEGIITITIVKVE